MPTTKQYTAYKFDELSPAAQEKAIEKYYDINVDYDGWDECVIEDFKEDMSKKGYDDIKVYYSGFSSQRGGACFEATIDIKKWLESHKMKSKVRSVWNSAVVQGMDYTLKLTHSGHYSHSGCMYLTAEAYGYPDKAYSQFHDILAPEIKSISRGYADALYKKLEQEYCYLTEPEAIKETLEANDYDFTEDGIID